MRERETRDLQDAHQDLSEDEEVVYREEHAVDSATVLPRAPQRRRRRIFDVREAFVLVIGAAVPRIGSCLAPRWKDEEDREGEDIEPGAQGNEDGVEEAGGRDVAVEVGERALYE